MNVSTKKDNSREEDHDNLKDPIDVNEGEFIEVKNREKKKNKGINLTSMVTRAKNNGLWLS